MGNKIYLGDGVFVDVENGMIKLTTEDGVRATNQIYLEPEVMAMFLQWWEAVKVAANVK